MSGSGKRAKAEGQAPSKGRPALTGVAAGKRRMRKKRRKGPAPSRRKQRRRRDAEAAFGPGDEIARCKVLGLLGSGSTGHVFLAEQPVIGRKVAVKMLTRPDPGRVARFHDEARKLARLDHPNIVELHDVGEHEGLPYIVLEYVEGRSLGELSSRGEGLSVPVLLRIAATVAGALEHAHRRGVVHKDVKPANIIVSPAGEPVLCDFSPSELVTGEAELDSLGLVGTPGYMSPEQARGEEATARADVWGLGATVFDLVAGRPPYAGAGARELVALAASDKPVDLPPLSGRAPECVISLVERCLRKDPAARYRSAEELRRAIEAAIDFIEVSGRETLAVPPPRKGQTLLLHVERREGGLKGKFREYEIQEYVGGGAYGDVYRARERLSGRDVALKVLRREWVSNQAAVARFRREARLLLRVSHPNVVRTYNFGRYGASFFIAMDFLEGDPLHEVLDRREQMDFGEAVGITGQVLSGLSAMHEAGVFHRDVKPANVMLVEDQAVLCDFGMATALDAGKLTTTGLVLGSPSYMSPEQTTGVPATGASDVYSAGVVLYEMLTGRLPHEEKTTREILRAIAKEPPAPVSEWRRGVPRGVADALARMLAKDPPERPTAAEATEMLAAGAG